MSNHDPDLEVFESEFNPKPLDKRGREIPDPTPMAPPIGYKKQPTIAERIRSMVQSEMLQRDLAAAGAETFDEANDFDEPGEGPTSIYEFDEDAELEQHLAVQAAKTAPPEPLTTPKASPPNKKTSAPKGADNAAGAADSDGGAE